MWLFQPELESNVTLWDSKYKALNPECEPQPLVQHYIARQRMVANSTGPTEELLEWTKQKVHLAYTGWLLQMTVAANVRPNRFSWSWSDVDCAAQLHPLSRTCEWHWLRLSS